MGKPQVRYEPKRICACQHTSGNQHPQDRVQIDAWRAVASVSSHFESRQASSRLTQVNEGARRIVFRCDPALICTGNMGVGMMKLTKTARILTLSAMLPFAALVATSAHAEDDDASAGKGALKGGVVGGAVGAVTGAGAATGAAVGAAAGATAGAIKKNKDDDKEEKKDE